ncbi:uncharacterized protein EAE97_003347 [Botrytis byssoidea]|uniref:Uncharacterized protein n=1 Tax=Botrytis byssoidea TaxID=139641 RepID=A0A9P5IQA6_9HELO|nr:uncharacterized protein EAE97_003347 [Botrytis byssoidea]KAF7949838.1 hypothetical protein EAE97_003347 [Botrytis byssoidea]
MVPSPEPGTLSHYSYDPSFSAAIVVGTFYSLAPFVTFFQWLRYYAGVWAIMVVAVAMAGAGYIIRAIFSKHGTEKSIYVAQTALIVLSPVLMAATCYIIFESRDYFQAELTQKLAMSLKLLWILPRFITPISVIRNILALLLQLICVLRITSIDITSADAQSKLSKGENIALVGVAIQMACFGLFSIIFIRFNCTSRRFTSEFQQRITLLNDSESKNEKYVMIDGAEKKSKPNLQALLHVVNITCALILIRSVFCIVDFALGRTGWMPNGGGRDWPTDEKTVYTCFTTVPLELSHNWVDLTQTMSVESLMQSRTLEAVSSVGLAGLSNATKNSIFMAIARKKHSDTVNFVIQELEDIMNASVVGVLQKVVVLIIFELINAAPGGSHSLSVHFNGALSLLKTLALRNHEDKKPTTKLQL